MMHVRGMAEPPEGAVVGESVPRENEEEAAHEAAVQQVAGYLKAHPAYHGKSEQELQRLARRFIGRQED